MNWHTSHAVVTGGSSGIGLATVRRLVTLGTKVSVIALGDEDLDRLATTPPPGPHTVFTAAADVGDPVAVAGAMADCIERHGPCDVLITSAGVARPGHFLEMAADEFDRQMRVNYFGTLHAVREVAPSMIERRRGSIVGVSSAAGLLGVFGYSAYGPTKYAVRGLCEVLRTELRPHRIHVGCAYPTDVDTPQLAGEEPFKPAETAAISGSIVPIAPEVVAAAIIRGIERRRTHIYTDRQTAVLARLVRFVPGLTQRWMDHKVRSA